jgi:hypothetical protein
MVQLQFLNYSLSYIDLLFSFAKNQLIVLVVGSSTSEPLLCSTDQLLIVHQYHTAMLTGALQ